MKNTPEKKYDVFISHSSKDDRLAMEIYEYLTQNDVTCWLDTCSILPGEPYSASIMKGLNASRCFMLLYTKNVIGSGHILNEIDKLNIPRLKAFTLIRYLIENNILVWNR